MLFANPRQSGRSAGKGSKTTEMNSLSKPAVAIARAAVMVIASFATVLAAPAAGVDDGRLFGATSPFLPHELPPGRLRDDLAWLDFSQQWRALRWLHRFDFPARDVASLRVTPEGGVLYADPPPDAALQATAAADPGLPAAAISLAAQTPFTLHSRPGATHTAYIDFDGHVIRDTAWNTASGIKTYTATPFDLDGDPRTFSDEERHAIAMIWHRVAEDYAPFDIDVTTQAPISPGRDTGHLVVTSNKSVEGDAMPYYQSGGVSYVGIWGRNDLSYYSPALVYYDNLWFDATMIAESVAHEFGHAVGLSHDGTTTSEYYDGHGDGDVSWAPVMGRSYYKNVTQWSRGDYPFANNPQDDVAILADVLGLVDDDHADTTDLATPLQIVDGIVEVSDPASDPGNDFPDNKGVIATADDVDYFAFETGGEVRLVVRPAWQAFDQPGARGANLDVELGLFDANRREVARSNRPDRTQATLDADVAPGTYYLAVRGTGSDNYDDYDSLGRYYISGTITPVAANRAPVAGFGFACAGLECSFVDASQDTDGHIVRWRWDFGDGTFAEEPGPRHRFAAGGEYVVTLTVTDDDGDSDEAVNTVRVAGQTARFEIVVDDSSPQTSHTGYWNVSLGAKPWGSGSVFNNVNRVFRWFPTVPAGGSYRVYAWWTYHDARSDTVPYTIEHVAGTSTVVVDQHDPSLAGQWVELGTFDFAAGTATVAVSSANGQANADAIRLVSVNELPLDTRQPDISMDSPADGAQVSGPVQLRASATDDTAVERVEFRVDGDPVGSVTQAPYVVDWDAGLVADGDHAVEATAFDINGNHAAATITVKVLHSGADAAFETIIDDADASTSRDGVWQPSSAIGAWDDGSLYSNGNGIFRWSPVLPGRGTYEVAAWWTHHPNRAAAVPYRVLHAGGEATVTVDQSDPDAGGRWITLGTYVFDAGPASVSVSSENGQASADAIRLRAVGATADDTQPPDLAIVSPRDGDQVGDDVIVRAEASDDVAIVRVEFLVDGARIAHDLAAPYTARLDLGRVTGADVVLTVQAYDASGNVTRRSITVTRPDVITLQANIIDNKADETATTGNWSVSAAPGPWDEDSLFCNAGGTFRWLPSLDQDGWYEVFAWWTSHPNRSDRVPYRVTHRSGTSEQLVNQRDPQSASQWVSLGVFDFATDSASVEVSTVNGQASADAVMFVRQ